MQDFIPFNNPYYSGQELTTIENSFKKKQFGSDGIFTKKAEKILNCHFLTKKTILVSSCTAALEISALALNLGNQDEILISSYTFMSTVNAFALRNCKIKFLDVEPCTMQFDFEKLKSKINKKTKAIVIVHYGGTFSKKIKDLANLCKRNKIFLIEDAAQSIGVTYEGKHLGTFGDLGCISFHHTKNIHCGEGGALLINKRSLIKRCLMIRDHGTNRIDFKEKKVKKYTWVTLGSNYFLTEYNAAFLYSQLSKINIINKRRKEIWLKYSTNIKNNKFFVKQKVDLNCYIGNGHIFFLILKNKKILKNFIDYMKLNKIQVVTHYTSLHDKFKSYKHLSYENLSGCRVGNDNLIRLPLNFYLTNKEIEHIIKTINNFSNE